MGSEGRNCSVRNPAESWPLLLALLMPAGAFCEALVYKSVDAAGHVTYSTAPAVGAVELQEVPVLPDPPEQKIEQALGNARTIQQEAQARFDALMEERREKKAEAQRRQLAEEAAARERRLQESLDRLQQRPPVYAYPWPWYRHRPGHPHRPEQGPRPPRPGHPYVPRLPQVPREAHPVRPPPPLHYWGR